MLLRFFFIPRSRKRRSSSSRTGAEPAGWPPVSIRCSIRNARVADPSGTDCAVFYSITTVGGLLFVSFRKVSHQACPEDLGRNFLSPLEDVRHAFHRNPGFAWLTAAGIPVTNTRVATTAQWLDGSNKVTRSTRRLSTKSCPRTIRRCAPTISSSECAGKEPLEFRSRACSSCQWRAVGAAQLDGRTRRGPG